MKKLYTTLALAAAVALSASAVDSKKFSKEMKVAEGLSIEMSAAADQSAAKTIAKAPQKAKPSTRDELVGYYDFRWFSNMDKDYVNGILVLEPGKNANDLLIYGIPTVSDNDGALEATFDASNGTISIPDHQQAFFATNYSEQAYINHYTFDANGQGQRNQTPFTFTVSEDGSLVFGEKEAMACEISKGMFDFIYRFTITPMAPMTEDGWTNVGKAQFTDGWFAPFFFENLAAVEVDVQRNNADPNIYRLVNPYEFLKEMTLTFTDTHETVFLNYSKGEGCIVFDMTDKDCVLVMPDHYAGLYDKGWGSGFYYMWNESGDMFVNDESFNEENTPADERLQIIKEWFPEEERSIYDTESRTLVVPFCKFTSSEFGSQVHCWNEFMEIAGESGTIEQTAVIVFPNESGINNIVTDASDNAPVEYFNLQGIRVNNPENGVFIRRQGKNVTKVVK